MGFRAGLVVGFGAGYVLGSKAGRERYDQIQALWAKVSSSPTVQRAVDKTTDVAGEQGRRALSVVQQGVEKAGGAVKERLGKEESSAPDRDPWRGGAVPDAGEGQVQ